MKTKQITIFGATGLIGSLLLDLLIEDDTFTKIIIVTRRPFEKEHSKIEIHQINFSNPEEIENCIENSSVVFSAIGTTKAQVNGDKVAYRKIDFDITYNIARACKKKNVQSFLFISSSGANSSSSTFYMRLKGEIDDAVSNLNLNSAIILRPSLLIGKRTEFRFGEKIAQAIMPLFAFLFPKNLKPISGLFLAKAMLNISKKHFLGNRIIENHDLIIWSKRSFNF